MKTSVDSAATELQKKKYLNEMEFASKDRAGLSRQELDESVEKYKKDFANEILLRQGKELDNITKKPAKPIVSKFKSFWYKLFRVLSNDTENR